MRSEALKYGANLPIDDSAENADHPSAPAQLTPEQVQAMDRFSRMSPAQQARYNRRIDNRIANLRRQEGRNVLARIVREERRKANRRAFAQDRKR